MKGNTAIFKEITAMVTLRDDGNLAYSESNGNKKSQDLKGKSNRNW